MSESEFAVPLTPSARGVEARRRVSEYCRSLSGEAWAVVHEQFPASILELDSLFRSIGRDIPVSDFGLMPGERDGETGTGTVLTGTVHTVGKRRRVGPEGGGGALDLDGVQAASSALLRQGQGTPVHGLPAGVEETGGRAETATMNASVAGPMSAGRPESRDGQADNGSLQTDNAALIGGGPLAYRGEETGDYGEYGATTTGVRRENHQMFDTAIGPQQGGHFPPPSHIGNGAVQYEGVTHGGLPMQGMKERARFEGLHSALSAALPRQFERIKREILEFIDAVGRVKLWIQLSIPRLEAGKGHLEVDVLEDIVRELGRAEESAFSALELQTKYYVARGKLVSKVTKYPDVGDYPKAVRELDEKEWVNVRLCARDLRDHTILLFDLITKNGDRLWTPRK